MADNAPRGLEHLWCVECRVRRNSFLALEIVPGVTMFYCAVCGSKLKARKAGEEEG